MIFSSSVPPSVRNGTPLVDYLASRFTYFDRAGWAMRLGAGRLTRNGLPASSGETVAPGDTIAYEAGEFEEPAADLSYRIIYEDEWMLGIDKPANLLVHRAGKSFRGNLIYQLRHAHVPPYPAAHAAHRLDRDTSGVVIVAKNGQTRAALGRLMGEWRVRKTYFAVVRGIPAAQEIAMPIGKPADSRIPYKFRADPGGKPALTLIVESRPLGGSHALVTLQPITGRTHQIRVHLAAIGAPVVGDKLYGLDEAAYLKWREDPSKSNTLLEFPRHALHCASLAFPHPSTGNVCVIEAPMPEDMRGLIERLEKETAAD